MAETYRIYDYKSLPVNTVATFCAGLRNDSRVKLKMDNFSFSIETILLAIGADQLRNLVWQKSNDGMRNINRPKSIVASLLNLKQEDDSKSNQTFNSPEEFEKAKSNILERR